MGTDGGAPPCCLRCEQLDRTGGGCRLLAAPTLDNRRRLLTMPCDVQRMLAHRFRAYGEDVARDARLVWLSPAWSPDDIARSFGHAPRDARLWLTSWPYFYLGRTAIRRLQKERADRSAAAAAEPPPPPRPDPALAVRIARALDRVHRVDPVSYAMVVDVLQDRFDAARWREMLGCSEATVTDRKYLGLYRYAAYYHEVLERVQPHAAAIALATRRFSPGDPDDRRALSATRAALGQPELALSAWRSSYREGATRSLTLLGAPDALGAEVMAEVGTAFRGVLRVN
ncbi:MAG TPA: hypothetical protein VFF45_00665 [Bacilli bacterium]|nr:hypothetical protein [Bacilli bacterium]